VSNELESITLNFLIGRIIPAGGTCDRWQVTDPLGAPATESR
jgi:hypothetical protein